MCVYFELRTYTDLHSDREQLDSQNAFTSVGFYLFLSQLTKSLFLILTVIVFFTASKTEGDDNHNLIPDSYFSFTKNATILL